MMAAGGIIVAGGEFSEWDEKALGELLNVETTREKPLLIAADRGLEHLLKYKRMPDLCIGDFDSVSDPTAAVIKDWEQSGEVEVIRLNPVKDDTDTEAALRLALERTEGDVAVFGGNGRRIDHLLANIHILRIALQRGRQAFLMDAYNRIRLIGQPCSLKRAEQYGKYVSLFPFGGKVSGLTLEGFKYPLERAELFIGSSLGTSNELVADVGHIDFSAGELVVVESRDGTGLE